MNGYRIPFIDLARQYENLREEILESIDSIYLSGRMIDGPVTTAFEDAIARRCNRRHAISINSGTQALCLAMMTMDDARHSGVMIPAVSFIATKNSVDILNKDYHVVDVNDQGLMDIRNIDISPMKEKMGILMYVNLYGNMVDQDRLSLYTNFFSDGLFVIEDAAQSFGASWDGKPSGSFGGVSILSFDPMKNLPHYGSGGMVLTDDDRIASEMRNLKDNGKLSNHAMPGTNCKMSEADCAAMLVKLKHFDAWQSRRSEIAEYYDSRLADYVQIPMVDPRVTHSWHKYVIQTDQRDEMQDYLTAHGVETKIHYPYVFGDRPNALTFTSRVLSLPIYPEMTDGEVEEVSDHVVNFFEDQIA